MTARARQALAALVVLLVVYTLLRGGFFAFNREFYAGIAAGEIARAFVHGLRFDLAAVLLVNVPLLAILLLPGDPARWLPVRVALFALFCAVNVAGILLNVADFVYYGTIQRRLLYEPYTETADIVRMMPGVLRAYWPYALLFAAAAWGFAALSLRALRAAGRGGRRGGWVRQSLVFVLAIVLAVFGIRGGFQLKPLRQTNAFFSPHMAVGYLVLNSTYTVVRSLWQPALASYRFLPPAEMRAELDTLVFARGERALDPAYPFLRTTTPDGPPLRRNVVILILESWTSSFVGALGGGRTATPFFDSLATRGVLFTRFIANGQRSIEAVPSILASVPGLWRNSIIGSQEELNTFRGLGTILGERGYTTAFLHGAATGSMGFDAFSRVAGFMRYYGKEDYPHSADSLFDGVWGLNDEPFFLDAVDKLDALPKPFCATLFSLSSHVPFEIPRYRRPMFARYAGETAFRRSLRYADFALGRFFQAARRTAWFDSTVFLITGDHTTFASRNSFSASFRIPLLVYAPGLLAPARVDRTCAQVDILPTVLDLLRIPAVHASMGRSAFDPREPHVAVVKYGPEFGLFCGRFLLVHDLERTIGLFDYETDPQHTHDLRRALPDTARALERALLAYVQGATTAIANDRIAPRPGSVARSARPR